MKILGKKGVQEEAEDLEIIKVPCTISNYRPNNMTQERDETITIKR